MKKRAVSLFMTVLMIIMCSCPVYAYAVPKVDTPNYKVSFYAFDCFNMQDENGKRSGYGYEMMQGLSKYMQCTFSYVGYDKSASECEEMLRNGEIDIYTAAKLTPERQKEFIFTKHPAITAVTCMNVKAGNTSVVPGDYSTYNGLRVGLLRRHTYNGKFEEFAKEKGFSYTITYYETPTELTNALIDGEVDALVNSYMGTPEDENILENFGETPYYVMARKSDQALIDQIDAAIDAMNIETPNWRTDLYNKYYGSQELNTELTDAEVKLLGELKESGTVITGVMDPDSGPYAWYEDGEAHGIAADIFKAVAEKLGLEYKILSVSTREEYQQIIDSGGVDVWMDLDGYYEDETQTKYKITNPYMSTSVSVLRVRGASEKIKKIGIVDDNISMKEILTDMWPSAEITELNSSSECVQALVNGTVDGVLMKTYAAQMIAREDVQNRLRADIVPGASLDIQMGVNANDDVNFYGLWEKTLSDVSSQLRSEIVQSYLEESAAPNFMAYMFDHPSYLIVLIACILIAVFFIILYLYSLKTRREQQRISAALTDALNEAEKANSIKQNFFSKMSHDIRTPLNVVLGMTQIAQKYKFDTPRLDDALESITSEGKYLLSLVNSILDVNQLEYGRAELVNAPFIPDRCLKGSVDILKPMSDKKKQTVTMESNCEGLVAVGDASRFGQIMINIISNAVKYTDDGGKIDVKLEYIPNDRYRFTCTDNGIGMSEDFVEHIFEDYMRAEDSRISQVEGTGLGMSVVKGFTDLMGGDLKVESELGKGSTFIVEIPFTAPTEEQRQAALAAEADEEEDLDMFTGRKVLLVEDNALNAEIATELLQTIGLTVDWEANGKLGLERFETSGLREYFAVFMDMQMPVMDGIEATKRIRASKRPDHDIPIFAMTANTFASDRKMCKDAGMDGYIAKPIDVKTIEDTLKDGIEKKNSVDNK